MKVCQTKIAEACETCINQRRLPAPRLVELAWRVEHVTGNPNRSRQRNTCFYLLFFKYASLSFCSMSLNRTGKIDLAAPHPLSRSVAQSLSRSVAQSVVCDGRLVPVALVVRCRSSEYGERESSDEWLVDVNSHLNDVHRRVSN